MFDQDGNRFHGSAAKNKQNFYYVNAKKHYRIRAERIEDTAVKYIGSLLKKNGILEQALKQVFRGENNKLRELDREISKKEKEIQQCEKVLEVMASQERLQIMANPNEVNAILLEGVRVRKESEDRIVELDKDLEFLYGQKEEIEKLSNEHDTVIKMRRALEIFKNSWSVRKKQLIQTMVPKLVINEKNDELNFFYQSDFRQIVKNCGLIPL